MTVTTSAKFNPDALQSALPVGASFSTVGGDLTAAVSKTVTFFGCTDAQGQTAITSASSAFVDRAANLATLQTQATNALATNRTYAALASPSTAQNTAEIKALAQQMNVVIRLLLNQLDATN